ncbi:MAG: hypothetical protein AAB575_03645 [Patescibacteria group bacterium]
MMTDDINGYVLVKDKDGHLKYYKDGKFFSVEEITKAKADKVVAEQKKIVLDPVLTFSKVKTVDNPGLVVDSNKAAGVEIKSLIQPVETIRPLKPISARPVAPAQPKTEPPKNSKPIELEDMPKNDDLSSRRSEDQAVISQRVDEVIVKLKIKFSEPEIEKRFRNILMTFFRGVRTVKELSYMLELPRANGGLELPREKAGLIVSVLEHTASEINRERKNIAAKTNERSVARAVADTDHQLMPPPPMIVPDKVTTPKVESFKLEPKKELKPENKILETQKPIAPAMLKPIVERPKPLITPLPPAKPKLESMQLEHRLVGPVQELQIMTLKDWRALGKDEKQSLAAILEKFQVLKAQSLRSLIQGREVWKKAPIFQLYLAMTFQALREKRSIAQVIDQRQVENKETLTMSEYEAFAELNRKIGEY